MVYSIKLLLMLIGVLIEGDKDERPLKVIVRRIIRGVHPGVNPAIITYVSDGPIESKIPAAITQFFINKEADLAVFVADSDGDRSKKRKLTVQVNKYNYNSKPIILACPDPELENWFFEEEATLKSIFRLSGSLPIPYGELKPKERLEKLFRESSLFDFTVTMYDIYEDIANNMNMAMLASGNRSSSFKKFYNDFVTTLKHI